MEFDDYTKIIDKIKRSALRVSLYDLGEPLAHKRIYDMIKYASDNAISTLISSNFNLFIKDDINKLFESKLTVLEPCLDGFSQENYEKYRKNGSVSKVKDGIVAVMGYKTTHKMKYPIVDVQVIKFDCIKHEMPAIDNFLRNECKVDKITYRQEILGFNSEETTIAYKNVSSDAPCFWLYLGMLIRPDGRVYPCCGNGFDRFAYGNILESNLKDIWNNKYYCFSRELFRKGKPLDATGEFKKVPCITCNKYKKQRKVIFS